jgi:N-acetyl-anhydromuramyl-L-alanine amidase AmpD
MSARTPNLIVIHCSATPSGKRIDRGTPGKHGYLSAEQVINSWHAVRGFKRSAAARQAFNPTLPSIGYHYVIDLDGAVLTGRHLDEAGAHAAQFNAKSVGICLVGGAERSGRYTRAQWDALSKLVGNLTESLRIPLNPAVRVPKAGLLGYDVMGGICGHRDLSPDKNGNRLVEPFEWLKTCPGFDVEAWLSNGLRPLPVHVFTVGA